MHNHTHTHTHTTHTHTHAHTHTHTHAHTHTHTHTCIQLIYDLDEKGGGTLGIISLVPDQIPKSERDKFEKIGLEIPKRE